MAERSRTQTPEPGHYLDLFFGHCERFRQQQQQHDEGYTSDQSWTLADELSTFYTTIHAQLTQFATDPERGVLHTAHLSKPHRRFVHATAKLLGLQHFSVGPARAYRQVEVRKAPAAAVGLSRSRGWEDFVVRTGTGLVATSAPVEKDEWRFLAGGRGGGEEEEEEEEEEEGMGGTTGLVRSMSAQTILPWELEDDGEEDFGVGIGIGIGGDGEEGDGGKTPKPKKRKRIPRREGGFCCSFEGCVRVFDRASDRKKYELSHRPTVANRHRCERCPKGFRYPKDLRRHLKGVHGEDVAPSTDGGDVDVSRIDSAASWIFPDDDLEIKRRESEFGKFGKFDIPMDPSLPLFGDAASRSLSEEPSADKVFKYLSGLQADRGTSKGVQFSEPDLDFT